jgi:signal transduction histidine kinase
MLTVRRVFFLTCTLLVAIPLALFWAWPYSYAVQGELDEVRERHLQLARNVAQQAQRYNRDLTAAFEEYADAVLAGRPPRLQASLLANLGFEQLAARDAANGLWLEGYRSGSGAMHASGAGELGGDYARLAAREGERGEGLVRLADGRTRLAFARRHGTLVITGLVGTGTLQELARSAIIGVPSEAIILDARGEVLARSTVGWRGLGPLLAGGAEASEPIGRAVRASSGAGQFMVPVAGSAAPQEVMAGYAPVAGSDWRVVVAQPLGELRARAAMVRSSALSVLAIGLLIAALVSLRAGLLIAIPIRAMIVAVRRMAAGDTKSRSAVASRFAPSELRDLEEAFNRMAESITEAKAIATEARERAEKANTAKTDFLRYVSHELRSPTNAIIGFSELLASERHGPLGAPAYREHVRDIMTGARHLLSLVNDLLDLSRIEACQYSLCEEEVGIDEVIDRCCRYLSPAAAERQIAVRTVYEGEPPTVLVDERALFQVILNLASNAVRYGREGGSIEIRTAKEASGALRLELLDDGPGIAAADLARVLEPFQRVDNERTRAVQGTGLGLPIVKRLIELHGGEFRLESEVDVGSRAIVLLPASRVVAALGAEQALPVPAAA